MVKNMSKLTLDSVEWGRFRIKDVFEVKRGKRHIEKNRKIGEIPYYSASSSNNGVTDFISNPLFIDRNKLLVSTFCDAFFAPKEFTASDEMTMLGNKYMNERSALFISRCIKSNSTKYAFGRKAFSERIKEQIILLPIDSDGSPNWQFMEDYIKKEMKAQSQKVIAYYENKLMKLGFELLDLEVEWKEFKIGALFDFQRGNQNNMSKCEDGDIPLISAKKVDNGLKSFIKNNDKKLFSRNIITLNNDGDGGVGIAYYQPYKTALDTHVTALIPREDLSSSNLLYISKVIEKQREKFSHGYSLNNSRLYNQKIMLPIDENGDPYWNYMNNFIKKIKKENVEKILNYLRSYND